LQRLSSPQRAHEQGSPVGVDLGHHFFRAAVVIGLGGAGLWIEKA
jgi:hypothetical protein